MLISAVAIALAQRLIRVESGRIAVSAVPIGVGRLA
jgi:hypothetical protein